jgi:hypothetical protein
MGCGTVPFEILRRNFNRYNVLEGYAELDL